MPLRGVKFFFAHNLEISAWLYSPSRPLRLNFITNSKRKNILITKYMKMEAMKITNLFLFLVFDCFYERWWFFFFFFFLFTVAVVVVFGGEWVWLLKWWWFSGYCSGGGLGTLSLQIRSSLHRFFCFFLLILGAIL
jgi:hypothetical protein